MGTRNFHWDPIDDCVMSETDQSGNTIAAYTHEPGQYGPLLSENRGGTEFYHHYDALGSTTMLTNDAGNVTDTFAHDAWGNRVVRTGSTPTPYQWVGCWGYQFNISTGGYYIRERTYSPNISRWTSVDYLRYYSGDEYAYTKTSPSFRIDPSGLWPEALEVTLPQKPTCSMCGTTRLEWRYNLRPNSRLSIAAIVQKICVTMVENICDEFDGCCKVALPLRSNCCYYELLGTVDPEKATPWVDIWTTPGAADNKCSGIGFSLDIAEVRGFGPENFLEVTGDKWDPPGLKPCGHRRVNFGLTKTIDSNPPWWNQFAAFIAPPSIGFVAWTCCGGGLIGAAGFYQSNGVSGVFDCK